MMPFVQLFISSTKQVKYAPCVALKHKGRKAPGPALGHGALSQTGGEGTQLTEALIFSIILRSFYGHTYIPSVLYLFIQTQEMTTTPVLLPWKFYGQKSLVGGSPQGPKVRRDWLSTHTHTFSKKEQKKKIVSFLHIFRRLWRKTLICPWEDAFKKWRCLIILTVGDFLGSRSVDVY